MQRQVGRRCERPSHPRGLPTDSLFKRIVLDLTDLTHMDSSGLGTVVRLYVSAKSAGCALELINRGPRIRQLLGVTNLLSVFTTICEHDIRKR
jgi:anti-sigma B factor antagonist